MASQRSKADFVVRQIIPVLDAVSLDGLLYTKSSQEVGERFHEDLLVHLIKSHCSRHRLTLPNPSEFNSAALRVLETEISACKAQLEEENAALVAVKLKKRPITNDV